MLDKGINLIQIVILETLPKLPFFPKILKLHRGRLMDS